MVVDEKRPGLSSPTSLELQLAPPLEPWLAEGLQVPRGGGHDGVGLLAGVAPLYGKRR
jgi:hypothetical protein